MKVLSVKLKEVLFAVGPITVLVLLLNFTLTPVAVPVLLRFFIGTVMVIIGLTLFLFGTDIAVTPSARYMGTATAKINKIWIVIGIGLFIGFFVSVAEPDLHILAGQTAAVTGGVIPKFVLVITVSAGLAVMIAFGLARILYNLPLRVILAVLYGLVLVFGILTPGEFLAISFDASGSTTGALAVPFILAFAVGVSALKKDSKVSKNDSFGLVAVASVGAILAVMITGLILRPEDLSGTFEPASAVSDNILLPFLQKMPVVTAEILIALTPIVLIFCVYQLALLKLRSRRFAGMLVGFFITLVGLVLFLTGVVSGFMDMGGILGDSLAASGNKGLIVLIGFVLGLVTILAEPAVHVLTHQIEDITSGYVRRSAVMVSLSLGVGAAIALSMLRIVTPALQLWHFLLPGYLLCTVLSFLVPPLFVGIAYDSGGVASGPMTATFILAFSAGVARATPGADVLTDGFGMIAMVAMTPIIALQLLGLVFRWKSRKKGVEKHG